MSKPVYLLLLALVSVWQCVAQSSEKNIPGLLQRLHQSGEDTNRVHLLLQTAEAYVLKPGEQAVDLDSAILLAAQAEDLSTKLGYKKGAGRCCIVYAGAFRERGQVNKARLLARYGTGLLESCRDSAGLSMAYEELSEYYRYANEEITEKVRLFEKALSLYERFNGKDKFREAYMLEFLGDLYQVQGDYPRAAGNLQRALLIYQSIGHDGLQGVYSLLGEVYFKIANYPRALDYDLLAAAIEVRKKDSCALASTIYLRLGNTYYQLGHAEEAIQWYKAAQGIAQKNNDSDAVLNIDLNTSVVYYHRNHFDTAIFFLNDALAMAAPDDTVTQVTITNFQMRCYLGLKNPGQATACCKRLLALCDKPGPPAPWRIWAYETLIRYYAGTNRIQRGHYFLELNDALCRTLKLTEHTAINQLWWFKTDSTAGNYIAAIRHYQLYKAITDSLVVESQTKQVAQVRLQNEIALKEKDMKEQAKTAMQVLQHTNDVQRTALQHATLVRNVIAAGVVMLLLLLALLYNRYRLKKRSNRELELKQEQINSKNASLQQLVEEKDWLVNEIQHRVRNNLQIVISLLNAQTYHLDDEKSQQVLLESRHRMQAMSIIHQRLYLSANTTVIDMQLYVQEMIVYLEESFDNMRRVQFNLDVAPILLDVSQAVPMALIMNEAVTNALKYAFEKDSHGSITLLFQRINETALQLVITDNGKGLPQHFDKENGGSTGMDLMRLLSRQLEGQLTVTSESGVTVMLVFTEEHPARRKYSGV